MTIFYALFQEKDHLLFTNVTDDMNSEASWAQSGLLFTDKDIAEECAAHWTQAFGINEKIIVRALSEVVDS